MKVSRSVLLILGSMLVSILALTWFFLSQNSAANAQLTLEKLSQSCFAKYSDGSLYSGLTLEIRTYFPNIEREEITEEQIECVLEKLDFPAESLDNVKDEESGRLDNESFQLKWKTIPVCLEGNPFRKDLPKITSKYSDCSSDPFERPVISLVFKDFR
jgi:hypothetical protein